MSKNKPLSPQQKEKKRSHTRRNKIAKLELMLKQNPNNEEVKQRLEYWKGQSK